MEGDLWWKTPLMDDDDGKQPLIEKVLWLKTTLNRRQPLMEDDLPCKTTLEGRHKEYIQNIIKHTKMYSIY